MGNNVDGDARTRKDIENGSASGRLLAHGQQSGWFPLAKLDINQQNKS